MHILILASFYPSATRPQTGIFFAEQVLALHEAGHQVGVLVLPRIRETLYTWRRHLPLPPALSDESGLFPIYRMHYGWFPRIFPKTCAKLAERFGLPAYRHYVQRHGPPSPKPCATSAKIMLSLILKRSGRVWSSALAKKRSWRNWKLCIECFINRRD